MTGKLTGFGRFLASTGTIFRQCLNLSFQVSNGRSFTNKQMGRYMVPSPPHDLPATPEPYFLIESKVSIINRHAGSRQLAKFVDKNFFQKSGLKEGVPKVFANGSNEVSYADTSGVSCWWG